MSEKLRELRAFVEARAKYYEGPEGTSHLYNDYNKRARRDMLHIVAEIDRLLAPEGEAKQSLCPRCNRPLIWATDGLRENLGYCSPCVKMLDEADRRMGIKM